MGTESQWIQLSIWTPLPRCPHPALPLHPRPDSWDSTPAAKEGLVWPAVYGKKRQHSHIGRSQWKSWWPLGEIIQCLHEGTTTEKIVSALPPNPPPPATHTTHTSAPWDLALWFSQRELLCGVVTQQATNRSPTPWFSFQLRSWGCESNPNAHCI